MVRKGVGERTLPMLGIDVSKATLTCALRDPLTRQILWEEEVANKPEGFRLLLDKTDPNIPWVLEPTGRYTLAVVQAAKQAGREVKLAAPKKAKQFLRSLQPRAKTDKLDGRGLALYGLACDLPAYPVKEACVEQLDQHLSARRLLSKTISKFQQQMNELPEAKQILAGSLAKLQEDLKQLDQQIAQLTRTTPAFACAQKLDAVPGIGPVTAAMVASRLISKQFAHPDQFVAYCGLDVGVSESGKRKGHLGLSKQGDAELRRLLYLAAQANRRCNQSPFKEQFERERAKGLSVTGALCAVARKLAKVCWSLHKYGTEYEASRVATRPAPKETGAKTHETQNRPS
jgi:transposase